MGEPGRRTEALQGLDPPSTTTSALSSRCLRPLCPELACDRAPCPSLGRPGGRGQTGWDWPHPTRSMIPV